MFRSNLAPDLAAPIPMPQVLISFANAVMEAILADAAWADTDNSSRLLSSFLILNFNRDWFP